MEQEIKNGDFVIWSEDHIDGRIYEVVLVGNKKASICPVYHFDARNSIAVPLNQLQKVENT
ncbi:MAG: hypothetical protein ACLFUH_05410 [Bacteroidales bacterium]